MNPRNIVLIAGSVLVTLFLIKFFDLATLNIRNINSDVSAEFSVTGEGKVEVVPDTTHIDGGISVSNVKTAEEAQNKIAEVNNKIVAALEKLGIKKEDIKTSNYSVNPDYDYGITELREGESRISGYSGNANVTVKIEDQKKVSQAIQVMTDAGATNVGNPRFEVGDPNKYREEARNKAIENAKQQADRLSKTLGIKLGRIVNMTEDNSTGGPEPYYGRAQLQMIADKAEAPEIEPGTNEITSIVTLYFERK